MRDEDPGGAPEDAPVGDDALEDVAGGPGVERGQRVIKQVEVRLKHLYLKLALSVNAFELTETLWKVMNLSLFHAYSDSCVTTFMMIYIISLYIS